MTDIFADKVAIITGSARGIGLATARLLVERGARVVITDIDETVAKEAAAGLPGEVAVHSGDLTDMTVPGELVDTAISAWGRLDIVINNAGYTLDAPLHKMTDEAFQAMLDIHTVVPFRMLRAAAPYLREPAKRERAAGQEIFRKVVNVTSLAGTAGNSGQANYSSAKAGMVGLTKTMAKEWGQFKINVNAVAFGLIDTRLTGPKSADSTVRIGARTVAVGVPEQVRESLGSTIPLGRAGSAAEAAGGIAFLCSPWSNYITGQVLNVSGGAAIGMDS